MGLITEEVEVVLNPKNIKHYENLGYEMPRQINKLGKLIIVRGSTIKVKVRDLSNKSQVKIDVKCDNCGEELKGIRWHNYLKYIKEDNKYYCNFCVHKLYAGENIKKTRLKNGQSFQYWCIENNRQDIIDRFDMELNNCLPNEINYGTAKKYYFKCPKGIHKSELNSIHNFTKGCNATMNCNQCNSLGMLLEDKGLLYLYSDKNKRSPYEYTPNSSKQKLYWKCPEGIHEDYPRKISNSNFCDFRCPECDYSKGEERISNYFISKGLIKISDEDYKILDEVFKQKYVYYIPQKNFDGLIGLGNRSLSYDFYLPYYNFLIEYDGEFHYKAIKLYKNELIKYAEARLKKQQEHDRLKDVYAQNNNIKLLRIPYWDFDNIELILDNYLQNDNIKIIGGGG